MSRPTSRAELLDAAATQYAVLIELVATVPDSLREVPGACEQWSVKDLLSHLDAWHHMFIGWETEGSKGQKPPMPAAGYTWADTPALNAFIQERTADDCWGDVIDRLHASQGQAIDLISKYSDDELFTKKRYPWTGTTSIGSYAASATSSHYAWASELIRNWVKKTT